MAIDGPAAAGKSTAAKTVAERLGIIYLDTGAMYRAAAYACMKRGVSVKDAEAVGRVMDGMNLEVTVGREQRVIVDGEDVTDFIREHSVSKAASDVSAIPSVRVKMAALQRKIAGENGAVLDGRDIGTYVLPDADLKIFLTAGPEVRAERRFLELKARGQDVSYEQVLADLAERDRNDATRALAPLKMAEDAILLDTSGRTPAETAERILEEAEKKLWRR